MIWTFVVGVAVGGLAAWSSRWRRNSRTTSNSSRSPENETNYRDQLAELSEATGGLAHEIRNPLSTFKVNLDLLAEDWRDEEQDSADVRRRSLNRIDALQHEAGRLQRILDDFLKFAGHFELTYQDGDLNDLLDRLVAFTTPQATTTRVVIRKMLCDEPLGCRLDVRLLEQALLNLFLNALQAMPEGGELIVKSARTADGYARVDIADTGTGIAPEHLDKVFKAYFSTKKQGTGLGLSMTQRIIREHGGRIDVDSRPGQGTTFSFVLPLGDRAVSTSR